MSDFVGLGVLRCRLPVFTDSIYIQSEMKYILLLLVVILAAFGVQEVAEDSFNGISNTQLIINILFYVAIEVCNFLCILITTRYVLRKVSILLTEQKQAAAGAEHEDDGVQEVHYVALKGDGDGDRDSASMQSLKAELTQCLSQQNSFDLFFAFLAKEFRSEILIFLKILIF